ncbi:MAG: hypothetical protein ACOYOB_16830 [Myxococcota bacterium]
MSICKLRGHSGTANAQLASVDIRADGTITGLLLSVKAIGMGSIDNFAEVELSFSPGQVFDSNDIRTALASVRIANNATATYVSGVGADSVALSGLKIPVAQGERVYMYGTFNGSVSDVQGTAYLYIEDGFDERLRRR